MIYAYAYIMNSNNKKVLKMCPDWELNQWLFGLQAGAQPTDLHQPGLFIFRERERVGERQGEKHWCARDTSIGCLLHTFNWVAGPQLRYMPWLGIESATFWFSDRHSIHWATTARAIGCFLYVPWLRIDTTTLIYGDDTLTNWATGQGTSIHFWRTDFELC